MRVLLIVAVNHWQLLLLTLMVQVDRRMPFYAGGPWSSWVSLLGGKTGKRGRRCTGSARIPLLRRTTSLARGKLNYRRLIGFRDKLVAKAAKASAKCRRTTA
jgi:hypothetical protein